MLLYLSAISQTLSEKAILSSEDIVLERKHINWTVLPFFELYHSKCSFLNDKIVDCGNNFKSMFRTINDILQKNKPTKLPDHNTAKDLADQFATYFATNSQTIKDNLDSQDRESSTPSPISHSWDTFAIVNEDDLREIVSKAPSPSCILDPLPSWMVKSLLDSLLPTITAVVNSSLMSGIVPDTFKEAVIAPLLKKANLYHNTWRTTGLWVICPSCPKCLNVLLQSS